MEIKTEVKTYLVNMRCEKCHIGDLVFNGFTKTSNPPYYSHTCNHCGHTRDLRDSYPRYEREAKTQK